MVLCLRGWNEDTADYDGDFLFANSQAQFNLTIPGSYTPGDPFTMTFTGGIASEGTPPSSASALVGVQLYNQPGGLPLDIGPFSDTGFTYAIGNTYIRYQPASTFDSWSVIGAVTALDTGNMGQTNISANTLADGSPTAPGEGSIPSFTSAMVPVGWYPAMAFIDPPSIPIHTVSLNPGDTVNVQFFTQSTADDPDNPTYSFYPFITSIVVRIGGEDISIPLASVKTGFHLGATSVPWTANGQPAAPWNAYGTVSGSQPPQAAIYQDMWLSEIGTQRGQGYIF